MAFVPTSVSQSRPPLLSYGLLALSMALVGAYVGLSPLLVAVFPVMLLAWMRFAVAAVAMAGWIRPNPEHDAPLGRREHGLLFLQSLLGNFLFTLCALQGAALTGALAAGVTMAAIPAAVAVLSSLFLGERLSRRIGLAILCSCLAVALLALARTAEPAAQAVSPPAAAAAAAFGDEASSLWRHPLLGYGLLLAAVLCEASYVVIGKMLSPRVSPRRVTAMINLWGLALSTPWALGMALHFDFAGVSAPIWALFLFYALAASVATVWLWMKGLARVPAQKAGVFTVLLPLSSAGIGILALGEPAGLPHLVALGLAVTAVLLVTREDQTSIAGR